MALCNGKSWGVTRTQSNCIVYAYSPLLLEGLCVFKYSKLSDEYIEKEITFFSLLTEAAYESFPALKHTPGQLGQQAEPV